MKEIWRDIKGYEGYYKISNYGQLYSYPRRRTKGGYTYGTNSHYYLEFTLSKKGVKERKRMHILVYETFVGPVPKGYQIHHKNHIRTDNRLDNLELIEKRKHSILHNSDRAEGAKNSLSKPVLQYTLEGEFVAEYPSTIEAARQTNICQQNISRCCTGKHKTAGGFIWKFKNITDSLAA